MSARKQYKTNGARMANSFDAGPVVARKFPKGTFLKIDCPDCLSEVGEKCRSNTGTVLNQVHVARRRIGIRKYYADLEAAQEVSLP